MTHVTRRAILGAGLGIAGAAFAQTRPGIPVGLLASRTRSGGAYGLSNAIAGVPFAINTPTLPTTTSGPTTVTPANISSSLSVNGRHMVLSSGTYSNLTISGTDQLLTLQAGATLTGTTTVASTAARVMFQGETARVGSINRIFVADSAQDIYFYRTNHQGDQSTDENFVGIASRVAFVGCTTNMIRYSLYADRTTDLILANCLNTAYSGSATPRVRLMSCNRTVVVDNRIVQSSQKTLRIHATDGNSDDHYIARNQVEEGGLEFHGDAGSGGAERLIEVTCINNLLYSSGGGEYVELGSTDQPEIFTFTGNTAYGYAVMPSQNLPAWTVTPNTSNAYQAPAAWSHAA